MKVFVRVWPKKSFKNQGKHPQVSWFLKNKGGDTKWDVPPWHLPYLPLRDVNTLFLLQQIIGNVYDYISISKYNALFLSRFMINNIILWIEDK